MNKQYEQKPADSWVYYNGELYHAGVKGMHWYQHLPGTDWWKVGKSLYKSYSKPTQSNSKPSKLKALGRAVKAVGSGMAKQYGSYIKGEASHYGNKAKTAISNSRVGKGTKKLWNAGKGYTSEQIKKFKDSANQAYKSMRSQIHNFFDAAKKEYKHSRIDRYTSLTHLEEWAKKESGEAAHAYVQSVAKGGVGNAINSFIQSSQMRVATGVNQFLKNIGMTDEVDKFLSKFMGESDYTKNKRRKARKDGGGEYYL